MVHITSCCMTRKKDIFVAGVTDKENVKYKIWSKTQLLVAGNSKQNLFENFTFYCHNWLSYMFGWLENKT